MQRPITGLWVLLCALLAWLAVAWADTLTVTVPRANVRQGPGLSHGVIATVPRGATFPVLRTQGGWRQIQLDDGRQAWIADSVVRVESSGLPERGLERLPEAASQRRVALVVGNAAYAERPLRNPVNDATDVAATLRQLGFEVELVRDAGRRQMQDAVRAFGRRLAQGGAGLFYFAGHGLQVAGENYLVPIGADIKAEFDVEHEAVSAGWILSAMDYAGNGLNLMILDACRNNPYSRRFRGGSALGLAAPAQQAKGSLVAYATSPNAVAEDGSGRNGLYTKHLLRYMKEPGLGVEEMFKKVRIAVERESGGRQTPWELSSLTGDFSFTLASTAESGVSDAEAQRLAEERQRIAAERRRLEEERELLAEQLRKREREPGRRFRDCDACPEMVVVPAGSFMMGSPASEEGRYDREAPQHRVTITEPFAVGLYEVTRGEFARFVRETNRTTGNSCWLWDGNAEKWEERSGFNWRNPGHAQTDRHPVVCVNWEDAQAYVRWLSGKTGHRYRLLSESKWEYVARAGTTGPFHTGSTISTDQANYDGNYTYGTGRKGAYRGRTVPAGSFSPNGFGLHDVHGNVNEWVQDCWHDRYDGVPGDGGAWETGDCSLRVLRGGSWFSTPRDVRAAFRNWSTSTGNRVMDLGFRVSRTLNP